jgi:hypothetical protein
MSCFAIIKCQKHESENWILRAREGYKRLNPDLHNVNPIIFSGNWGICLIWPGTEDKFFSYSISQSGEIEINLGWGGCNRFSQKFEQFLSESETEFSGVPLDDPELSLGIYCFIRSNQNSIVCVPDPYSAYPIFHIAKDLKSGIVSNNALLVFWLENIKPEIDKYSVFERIVTEGNLDGRFLFSNIYRLNPLSWIFINNQKTNILQYHLRELSIGPDELISLFLKNAEKLIKGKDPLVLRLTGGYDSRLNLLLFLKAGLTPLCYTIKSVDSYHAKRLSNILNLDHILVDNYEIPYDTDSRIIAQFNEIKNNAVFITGGCAELARGFYFKKTKFGKTKWEIASANFLSSKKIALLSEKKINLIRKKLAERWEQNGNFQIDLRCDIVDLLYIDRIRTWYAEAWATPHGTNNVPFLVGPAMNTFGRSFSLEDRRDGKPQKLLFEILNGTELPPILKLKPDRKSKIFSSFPSYVQVIIFRLKYITSKKFHLNLLNNRSFVFKDILFPWEEAIVQERCSKDYKKINKILTSAIKLFD